MWLWALLWGNGRAEIQRNVGGDAIALWPIHPSRCATGVNDNDAITHRVFTDAGYVDLADRDVLHVIGMSTNGVSGLSVVAQARESLGLAVAAQEYGAHFYANDTAPRAAIQVPEEMGEEAYKRLKRQWEQKYGGENRHRIPILEQGATVQAYGMPNNDAQFLETRVFQTLEIARWFNVPPHKLGELTHATFSNIEHQQIEYVEDTVTPWAVDMEEECDRKLFRPSERGTMFCEFQLDGLLRGDSKTRNEVRQIQRQSGIINADEWRQSENMNPQPDGTGQVYWRPANFVPADTPAGAFERRATPNGD
jgi:HK97 family phage portal protein